MNELRRRAAFWRNLEYDLDQMSESVEAKSAERWANKSDTECLEEIKQYLLSALATSRTRYTEVLQAQINEWEEEKEMTVE